MPSDKNKTAANPADVISLADAVAGADPNALDDLFKALRENHAMAGQTLGAVISVSALLLGLSAVPVALALASLALPAPGKSLLTSWGIANPTLSSGIVLALVIIYGFALGLYLPIYTIVPALRVARSQVDLTIESLQYALADIAEKRAIVGRLIQRTPRRYFTRRSSEISYSNLLATYTLAFSYFLFVLAALVPLLVIVAHIPAQ